MTDASDSRQYPGRPIVGVGGVVISADERIVLIKRRYEPLQGQWSLPGGAVEVGETLTEAVVREIREETGLDVAAGPVIEVFDRITRDDEYRVRYHYVLIDYLCWPLGGTLHAGSDVEDAVLITESELGPYRLTEKAIAVIRRALQLAREAPRPAR